LQGRTELRTANSVYSVQKVHYRKMQESLRLPKQRQLSLKSNGVASFLHI
jgi:hypothetical protein